MLREKLISNFPGPIGFPYAPDQEFNIEEASSSNFPNVESDIRQKINVQGSSPKVATPESCRASLSKTVLTLIS